MNASDIVQSLIADCDEMHAAQTERMAAAADAMIETISNPWRPKIKLVQAAVKDLEELSDQLTAGD